MFTGIIEEVGKVSSIRTEDASIRLQIQTKEILKDIHIGDSIAVNGICLTVTKYDTDSFCADVMHETMNRTSLKLLRRGSKVNLERAMAANGRFGGHIVSGHIDGTGTIRKMQRDSIAIWYTIETTAGILHYIVEKGSITIDGISLTVAAVDDKTFQVSVIPHTRNSRRFGISQCVLNVGLTASSITCTVGCHVMIVVVSRSSLFSVSLTIVK